MLIPEEEYQQLPKYQKEMQQQRTTEEESTMNQIIPKKQNDQIRLVPVSELKEEIFNSVAVTYRHKVLTLFQFLNENPSFLKMPMMGGSRY